MARRVNQARFGGFFVALAGIHGNQPVTDFSYA